MPPDTARATPGRDAGLYREKLRNLREILFANLVMAGEIPAPTGRERRIAQFLSDRFTEAGLSNISLDQAGNVAGVRAGCQGGRNLLVLAPIDKIWPESEDHTMTVGVGSMTGRGLADNALGVAALASLPLILEELGLSFSADLVFLGCTRSLGRGNLGGMRFFLEHSGLPIAAALCLEGAELGRLSYSSLGVARGEIEIQVPDGSDDTLVLRVLAELVQHLQEMDAREEGEVRVLIGSLAAGSGHGIPPRQGILRFEVCSRRSGRVARIETEIAALVESLAHHFHDTGMKIRMEMIAHRRPGNLGVSHPLVREAKGVLRQLSVSTHVSPSVSELSLLLEHGIPALTLGISRAENRHTPTESIQLDPIFDGLAQVVSLLSFLDTHELA